jgi:predicted RNase H-like nuclease
MLFYNFYLSAIRQRQSSVYVMPIRHALYMSRKQSNASLVSKILGSPHTVP